MKKNFIELSQLIYNIAVIPNNHIFFNKNSMNEFPNNHIKTFKICKSNVSTVDYDRFEPNDNIYPGVLSETALLLNQALSMGYEFLWYEDDFKTKRIHSPGTSPQIKERATEILTYATNHDCWNYDHFWDKDGDIKELIYIEKRDAAGLLDRQKIKYSFKLDETFEVLIDKKPEELYEQLKREGLDQEEITRQLINTFQLKDYKLGILLDPDPPPPDPDPEKTKDAYRKRGTKRRLEAFPKNTPLSRKR